MKVLKNKLFSLGFFLISMLLLVQNVFAESTYITYTEIKVRDELVNGASYSYDGTDGDYIEYQMNERDNNIYSFILTGYNLNDNDEYTYTLKSDFKDFNKTFTGQELKNGVVISGEDGNSFIESKLVDNNNIVIKNKHNDIYFNKTIFKFNDNFDSSKMDEYFNEITNNGKMQLQVVDPRGDAAFAETAISASLQKYETKYFGVYGGCYDEDGTCSLSISNKNDYSKSKTYPVDFEFVTADKKIKEKADKYAKTFDYTMDTIEKDLFVMEDLETINYKYAVSIHGDSIDTLNSIINYSSEFQNKLDNTNFTAILDSRAGWNDKFTSGGFGFLNLLYDGVIYSYAEVAGVKQNNVIYVPDNTKDTREDFIKVAVERIKEYIPEIKVKIEYAGQIEDLNFDDQVLKLDDIVDEGKTLGEYYKLTINEDEHFFFIAKDSSKMRNPIMNTKDVNTDISISTDSSEVPLDTKVTAVIIDSNSKDYKDFLKRVKISKGIVVDLKLFSESINKNISKINNNKFKVYIPLSDELKNLDLMAYYIKDNGEIENYNVTIEDKYLVFETNHFSAYIIGEEQKNNIENPPTNDEIIFWMVTGLISGVGIISLIAFKKKYNL